MSAAIRADAGTLRSVGTSGWRALAFVLMAALLQAPEFALHLECERQCVWFSEDSAWVITARPETVVLAYPQICEADSAECDSGVVR